MYNDLYNALLGLFDGAPSYVLDYILPITISIIFLIVVGVIVWLLFKIPKIILGGVKFNDNDETPKTKKRRFK